jgi:putative flippase GtrA
MLEVEGDRFEYEMNMLLDAPKNKIKIEEETIETIYEDNNSGSHFNTIKDSYRIYKQIFKFIFSSISSFVVDYILYTLLNIITGNLVLSNIVARVFSSLYNYTINRNIVFKDKKNIAKTMIKYYILAACILAVNTLALLGLTMFINKYVAKVIVEVILFIISYFVQKRFIFR